MKLKDISTGEVVGMRYAMAMAAVEAGTHEIVNEGEPAREERVGAEPGGEGEGDDAGGDANHGGDLDGMTKDELLAVAKERGLNAKPAMSKAEILAALRSAE
ncbi:hypothetical protein DLJ53_17985 [Acuticoccus sediminis]|uniref:Rho termination factor-like protein n=1 Tax=Acuticoccus sediminis TaxID=2184697 RepID=A0A8B2NN38_9HYPH|nr:hypothetical protein [Acuticoccus sediminis]RAI01106.1 hypothetical protein DLJ53_17985 [Acuticoccus sediminis]